MKGTSINTTDNNGLFEKNAVEAAIGMVFVDAVVVAISYTLFMAWVEEERITPPATDTVVKD